MLANLTPFLLHWAITAFALWVASHVFKGIQFSSTSSLVVSALLLGLANAIVRPLLVFLTLPLTVLTFGLFLLVINSVFLGISVYMSSRASTSRVLARHMLSRAGLVLMLTVDTAIYRTSFPRDGETAQGPAIIEFPGQSVVVPPGATATSDRFGNIHVRLSK